MNEKKVREFEFVGDEKISGITALRLIKPIFDESPSPSEAGDGWDDEDWIKFIQWYAGMNRSSVLQGINQYKSQTPDQ